MGRMHIFENCWIAMHMFGLCGLWAYCSAGFGVLFKARSQNVLFG
jgi:hypothetical protein